MPLRMLIVTIALTFGVNSVAWSHELWISPTQYGVSSGASIAADIRVGETFRGSSYPFIPEDNARLDLAMGDRLTPISGRMGDMPAISIQAPGAGLAVIVYQSTAGVVLYDKPEMFPAFVAHKDFKGVMAAHKARGLPSIGFRESFRRFAKSLIAVGGGAGADRAYGLETEIIALANPYTDDLTAGFPVRVLYQGKPRSGVRVEVFARAADGAVTVSTLRTDAAGRVSVPVAAATEYLIDSVVMRPLDGGGPENKPVWESLWASLTFKTPGGN